MVTPRLIASPRRRRRAARIAAGVIVVASIVGLVRVFDGGAATGVSSATRPGGKLVATPATVPLTAADRRQIDALLDRFIPAAVARRRPAAARALVTPTLRSAASAADWRRGELPLPPFPARGTRFHDWVVRYSYRNEANVDIILHAKPGATDVSAIASNIHLHRLSGRWLVDGFLVDATYSAESEPARMFSQRDVAPDAGSRSLREAKPRLGPVWWLAIPGLVLAVPFLALLAMLGRRVLERARLRSSAA